MDYEALTIPELQALAEQTAAERAAASRRGEVINTVLRHKLQEQEAAEAIVARLTPEQRVSVRALLQ